MSQSSSLKPISDDIPVVYDLRVSPPCEIYVDSAISGRTVADKVISFVDSTGETEDGYIYVTFSRSAQYGISETDWELLTSGVDEVETSFGRFRRRLIGEGVRSRARSREFQGKVRAVESWVYELVGGSSAVYAV